MDSAEVEIVAKKYLDSVYRVAINYSKNAQDAGDAVQNAFLKLIKTDLVFSDEEHIRRWLIKVTINECKSLWRKLSRHSISSLDELYDNGYELPAASQNEYNTADRARELWDAVMHLPAKYSIVIHLYYYEGYSVDEISNMVGISKSNVQIRLMRGRTKLKESLEETNYDGK
ncbi:MAG: RNA polymerase sigma factor [Lachnospiraceae bacterium]|nr:RNA polymerase sigma factor [Lachnospiraceae bacterium]